MTTGDIANHLQDLYGQDVSRDLMSSVTDAIVEDMQTWQNRPLDAVYPVLLIDAIMLKVRDGFPHRFAAGGAPSRRRGSAR